MKVRIIISIFWIFTSIAALAQTGESSQEKKIEPQFGIHLGGFIDPIYPIVLPRLSIDFRATRHVELFSEFIIIGDGFLPFWGARYVGNSIKNSSWKPYFGLAIGGHFSGYLYQAQCGVRYSWSSGLELKLGLNGIYEMYESLPENIGGIELGIGWRF